MSELYRPQLPGSWDLAARSRKVANDWIELTNSFPSRCQEIFDQLTSSPIDSIDRSQKRLKGSLALTTFDGQEYERWQIDINSSSRIWYFVIETSFGRNQKRRSGKVVIDRIYFGHPKSTE